jgi:hypothetical protein
MLPLSLPHMAVFFLPIKPAPHSDAGSPLRGVGSTLRGVVPYWAESSRRPMGKKGKTLCELCGSVVKYPFKERHSIYE